MGPGGPPLGARCMLCRGPRGEAWLRWNSFFSRELFGFDWASRVWFFPRKFWLPLGPPLPDSPEVPDFPRGNESPVCPRARFFPGRFLGPAGSPGLPARGVMHATDGETACQLPCPAWFTRPACHGIQGGGWPGPCGPPHDSAPVHFHCIHTCHRVGIVTRVQEFKRCGSRSHG